MRKLAESGYEEVKKARRRPGAIRFTVNPKNWSEFRNLGTTLTVSRRAGKLGITVIPIFFGKCEIVQQMHIFLRCVYIMDNFYT